MKPVYLSYILVSIGINGIFAVINILGASISGTVQKWAVYLLLAAAVFFCVSGIALGEPANMEPLFTTPQAVFTVLLMLPGFMSGFNAIPQAAEEGKVPHKMVGRVVIITIWAAAIFYLMIVLGWALPPRWRFALVPVWRCSMRSPSFSTVPSWPALLWRLPLFWVCSLPGIPPMWLAAVC